MGCVICKQNNDQALYRLTNGKQKGYPAHVNCAKDKGVPIPRWLLSCGLPLHYALQQADLRKTTIKNKNAFFVERLIINRKVA